MANDVWVYIEHKYEDFSATAFEVLGIGKTLADGLGSNLCAFVIGENVEVERKGTGRYGRIEALVSVNGENINQLMIINGYAWVNRQNCTEKFCNDWIKMEDAARQEKKGMWSEQNIASPKESLRPRGK